jgi:hypothetical protein
MSAVPGDGTEAPTRVQCVRLYTDADGSPRFGTTEYELIQMDFALPAPPVDVSAPAPASGVVLMRFPAGFTAPPIPAPARQLVLVLRGETLAIAGDESRRFVAGDLLLMEDTHGAGHGTFAVTETLLVIVRL